MNCEYDGKMESVLMGDEDELEEEDEINMENILNNSNNNNGTNDNNIEEDVDHMAILISAVEQRPILYASQSRGNGGNGREFNLTKEKAWGEVSYIVGREVVWCTRKWKSLRDTFVKKVNSLRGKNASVRRKIQSWTYFSSLTFLSEYIHHQSSSTKNRIAQHQEVTYSQQTIVPHIITTDFLEIGIQEEKLRTNTSTTNNNSNSYNLNNGCTLSQNSSTSSPSPIKRERDRDRDHDSNEDASQELWNNNKKPCLEIPDKKLLDVHDYFCMSLAQQMRTFSPTLSSEARMRISQIMFEFQTRSE